MSTSFLNLRLYSTTTTPPEESIAKAKTIILNGGLASPLSSSPPAKHRHNNYPNHNGFASPAVSTDDRLKNTVSIRPPHSRNSTVRRGFSGPSPSPHLAVVRCKQLDDYDSRCLQNMPVMVSEGVLKEARCSQLFVSCGEFPHRDRIPLEEKIRIGKDLSRKPSKCKITQAGGFSWAASNEFMPYTPNNVLNIGFLKKEFMWLKEGAFVKQQSAKRPRTKGLISEQISKLTSPMIRSFVPLHMRKAYTDLRKEPDLYALPGSTCKRGQKRFNHLKERASTSPATHTGFVLQKLPRGRLDTIQSQSHNESQCGSSVQNSSVPVNIDPLRQQLNSVAAVGLRGTRMNHLHVRARSELSIKEKPVQINASLHRILLTRNSPTFR